MPTAYKILIADPDVDSARALTKALRQKGHQVHYAPDGSRALELAVMRHPDLVLFDERCRLLDARTFSQILRTNPRTEDVPVVLTTASFEPQSRALRDGYLKKPFNLDEVLARIDHLFRRREAANELKGESKDIEGQLGQLPLPDLLQILAVNRRSGRLNLWRGPERAEIYVGGGKPLNARIGGVEGEKAFFRLLTWSDGNFAFIPGPPTAQIRIAREMEDALLEGLRQADEVARHKASLPPQGARIQLAPGAALPHEQHPVTAQVVDLLREPHTVDELLDLAPATDLEVLSVLSTLLQKGVAKQGEVRETDSDLLVGPAELHSLRTRLLRGQITAQPAVGKVMLLGKLASARLFLGEMPALKRLTAEPQALFSGFGTLGWMEVGEGVRIDFAVVPAAEGARPLWRPFSSGAVGALLLDGSDEAIEQARFLGWQLRVPLVRVGGKLPASLERAPGGSAASGEDLIDALRTLLFLAVRAPSRTTTLARSA